MSAVNQLLNAMAWVALRVWAPLEAKRRIDTVGSWLGSLDVERARRAAHTLRGGTCLSRAITIAARVPGAEVVIGARGKGPTFHAHAWVEVQGAAIGSVEPDVELARFR